MANTTDDPFDPVVVASDEAIEARHAEVEREKMDAFYERLRTAYVRVWGKGAALPGDLELIRADLERFCRGNTSAWHDDSRVHALLTGRQEVWLRIEKFLRSPLSAIVDEIMENRKRGYDV